MADFRPNFLGIGVQKGGTSTLHSLLSKHPDVFLPASKELHYFTLHYSHSNTWYQDHFKDSRLHQMRGEITPYYIFHPLAPARIHANFPFVRLIVLLRDPVERALSQLFHSKRLGFEPLEPQEALRAEVGRLRDANSIIQCGGWHLSHQEHSYIARSRYEVQLARYESLFANKQILILRSEDLFANPYSVWSRLQSFLGLSEIPLPSVLPKNTGRGEAASVPPELRVYLREQLHATYVAMKNLYGICWD